MLRIVVIGVGGHSQNHLSALAQYASDCPGEIELTAVCDLSPNRAKLAAEKFGFSRWHTDIRKMLERESPGACFAIVPVAVTASVSEMLIGAHIPLLMEKPPGANLEEARRIVSLASHARLPVMVSMNRRFDPAILEVMRWKAARPIIYIRAVMIRNDRKEPSFITNTGIHSVDAMRAIAGNVAHLSSDIHRVENVAWVTAHFLFHNGATGTFEAMPTAGDTEERYEIFGPDWRALIQIRIDETRYACWEKGRLACERVVASEMPGFIRDGEYGETKEFIRAVKEKRDPVPSPGDVLQSVELCHAILPYPK